MKRLLVPTDFSENAARALEYAIALANRRMGAITLFHASIPTVSQRTEQYLYQEAERQMEALVETYRSQMGPAASLTGVVTVGEAVPAIINQSHSGYDLLIMGTQGESGIKGFLLGSVTYEVMRRAEIPVLAIPQHAKVHPLRNILLAIDKFSVSAPETLVPLRELAQVFSAEIHVIHLTTEEHAHAAVPDLVVDAALEGTHRHFREEKAEDEIWAEVRRLADPESYDLLCLVRRERSFMERLVHHSVTREELSTCQIPLLILHDER